MHSNRQRYRSLPKPTKTLRVNNTIYCFVFQTTFTLTSCKHRWYFSLTPHFIVLVVGAAFKVSTALTWNRTHSEINLLFCVIWIWIPMPLVIQEQILGEGVVGAQPSPWDELRLSNTTGILHNMQICILSSSHYVIPSQKPSSSYSLLKFVYITSQLHHFLLVYPLLRKILDPPL